VPERSPVPNLAVDYYADINFLPDIVAIRLPIAVTQQLLFRKEYLDYPARRGMLRSSKDWSGANGSGFGKSTEKGLTLSVRRVKSFK